MIQSFCCPTDTWQRGRGQHWISSFLLYNIRFLILFSFSKPVSIHIDFCIVYGWGFQYTPFRSRKADSFWTKDSNLEINLMRRLGLGGFRNRKTGDGTIMIGLIAKFSILILCIFPKFT